MTLSFRYDARQASLADLSAEKDPAFYDLCVPHGDQLIVPRGWERLDRRTPRPAPEPEDSGHEGDGTDGHLDRYAALTAQLPRLAEAFGLTGPVDDTGVRHGPRPAGARGRPRHHVTRDGQDGPDAGGRVHIPTPPQDAPVDHPDPDHPFEPVTGTLLPDDVLDGQLQMPIEPEPEGVVVALTRARSV